MGNVAHVFQHKTTGVQMFVFHVKDRYIAKSKFELIVTDIEDWLYIGTKIIL